MISSYKIVFLSHTSRDSVYKVGSYHLSEELSRYYDILYISPPVSVFHAAKALINTNYRKGVWRIKAKSMKSQKNGRILSFAPFKFLTFRAFFPFNSAKFALGSSIFEQWYYEKMIQQYGFRDNIIVFLDSLNLAYMLDYFSSPIIVYRPTDDYVSMPNQSAKLSIVEKYVVDKAKSIIVTSDYLKDLILERYGRSATVIENGINIDLLSALDTSRPAIFSEIDNGKINLVYIGSLDSRIDLNLLMKLDLSNLFNIILCGNTDVLTVSDFRNVVAIKNLSYDQIGRFYTNADVGILPLDVNHSGNMTRSPMKLYEMLFYRIPVVSTIAFKLEGSVDISTVKYTSDYSEFITACTKLKRNRKGNINWYNVSWKKKAEQAVSAALNKVNSR